MFTLVPASQFSCNSNNFSIFCHLKHYLKSFKYALRSIWRLTRLQHSSKRCEYAHVWRTSKFKEEIVAQWKEEVIKKKC